MHMDKLLNYINSLDAHARTEFAAEIGTSINYLRKAISTGQNLRESLVMDIERATDGLVTCEELRPDLADRWRYLRSTGSGAGRDFQSPSCQPKKDEK